MGDTETRTPRLNPYKAQQEARLRKFHARVTTGYGGGMDDRNGKRKKKK